ncbi:MAG: flagellar hook-basal body complex protein FliE [Candidatus Eremiobacteraeota bacterium]|nr:flagellar hook-basal body complex protein FliE [Candidatus Eremiobacteraeota bacterium]
MTVTPLLPGAAASVPDAAPALESRGGDFGGAFARALDAAGESLRRADAAERAFASGRGGLQEMVVERAQADIALSIAASAVSRAAQALSTVLGMQV